MTSSIMKVIFSFLLVFFCVSFPLQPVSAAVINFDYYEADGAVTITDYLGTSTSVTIPSTINGLPVRTIGSYALSLKGLTSVTIPKGVTTIEDGAFFGNLLTVVTIPSTVKTIGVAAFSENLLTSVAIPSSVTTIEAETFSFNKLSSVSIPSTVTTIGDSAFTNNALRSVYIPAGVTTIEANTFSFNQLSSVSIPTKVTTIGDSAFANNALRTVVIPASVSTIEASAFANNQLTAVTIPANVTRIEDNTFTNNKLTSVTIPNGMTSIGSGAFSYNAITTITIPASLEEIGDEAFYSNRLATVKIPMTVMTIGIDAFEKNASPFKIIGHNPSEAESYANLYDHLFERTNFYTVTYKDNGATDGEVPIDELGYYINDIVTALDENSLSKDGHTFTGWNTRTDGTGTLYPAYSEFTLKGHTTLYAKWVINRYTIDYDTDGGTEIAPSTITHNKKIPTPKAPTKVGYIFAGWYADPQFQTPWNFKTDVVTEDTTLYAYFKEINYPRFVVKYMRNGASFGSAPIDNQLYRANEQSIILDNITLSKVGHTFNGWNTKANGSGKNYAPNSEMNILGHVTLYAQWKPSQFGTIDITIVNDDNKTPITTPVYVTITNSSGNIVEEATSINGRYISSSVLEKGTYTITLSNGTIQQTTTVQVKTKVSPVKLIWETTLDDMDRKKTGAIAGVVYDGESEIAHPVSGVTVKVVSKTTTWQTTTKSDGSFKIFVSKGTYDVVVESIDHKTSTLYKGVPVTPGQASAPIIQMVAQ